LFIYGGQILERRIPPVLIFVIGLASICWLHHYVEFGRYLGLMWGRYIVATLCFILSALFAFSALSCFKRASTTVNPVEPERTSKIVTDGAFQYSRNPMYFGLLLLLFSYDVYLGNIIGLIVCFFFVLYMTYFQILPEERVLERKFGVLYLEYKSKVRRWI